ncbi:putative saccharopine dehydrogenase, partial [Reticulomyxa filosa]
MSAMHVLCSLFERKLQYKEHEKDMVLLKVGLETEYPNGLRQTIESVLLSFGKDLDANSAMARTASLPLACAIVSSISFFFFFFGLHFHKRIHKYIFYGKALISKRRYNGNWSGKASNRRILKERYCYLFCFLKKVSPPMIWLRGEGVPEHRTLLTPSNAKRLLDAGFKVVVEKWPERCFELRKQKQKQNKKKTEPKRICKYMHEWQTVTMIVCFSDKQYKEVGCEMAPLHSWIQDAPRSAFIIGLRQLSSDFPKQLKHRHIYFADCLRGQKNAAHLLRRFKQ